MGHKGGQKPKVSKDKSLAKGGQATLLTLEVEHLAVFEPALQVVVDSHRAAACGATRIEEVARLEREIAGGIADELVDGIEHIGRATGLDGLAIDVEVEVEALGPEKLLLLHPFSEHGRPVEALGQLPRLPLGLELLLQFACREVYAHGIGVVVAMGKLQGDALAQTADTHDHLRLILDAPHVVGNEEGFAILQHSRVGLHKQYWALGLHGRAMERQVVLQIIHAYCKYLHLFSLLWLFYFSTFCPMRALTASRERSVREAI